MKTTTKTVKTVITTLSEGEIKDALLALVAVAHDFGLDEQPSSTTVTTGLDEQPSSTTVTVAEVTVAEIHYHARGAFADAPFFSATVTRTTETTS